MAGYRIRTCTVATRRWGLCPCDTGPVMNGRSSIHPFGRKTIRRSPSAWVTRSTRKWAARARCTSMTSDMATRWGRSILTRAVASGAPRAGSAHQEGNVSTVAPASPRPSHASFPRDRSGPALERAGDIFAAWTPVFSRRRVCSGPGRTHGNARVQMRDDMLFLNGQPPAYSETGRHRLLKMQTR
jgi:hypothetical protein